MASLPYKIQSLWPTAPQSLPYILPLYNHTWLCYHSIKFLSSLLYNYFAIQLLCIASYNHIEYMSSNKNCFCYFIIVCSDCMLQYSELHCLCHIHKRGREGGDINRWYLHTGADNRYTSTAQDRQNKTSAVPPKTFKVHNETWI